MLREHGSEMGTMPPEDPASQAPTTVSSAGRHRIEALIGRGGVGSVYRAFDGARGCTVAFKRLELGDKSNTAMTSAAARTASALDRSAAGEELRKQARRRAQLTALFQREYYTLAQLAHPRIIEVYDYGVDDVGPYYTMELLEGTDLSQGGTLPWRRACEVLRDVASALTLLHSRRLLHRDISPRNVHCTATGAAKLIDFGAMSPMGQCGDMIVGTPAYVAPEALQCQTLDARTDLYSVGALGYFLLTGRGAYPARSFAEARDAFRSHPIVPSTVVADIPPELSALIMQLLSMDRSARLGSAVELVERLTALANLEHDDRLAVANAYLLTPSLVGRKKELLAVRRRALRSRRGHGASLLVTGPKGIGRSRFLDACALEGKLAGALVLRGTPGASGGAAHGVVRALMLQLHGLLSDAERRTFEVPAQLSSQLVPGLTWTHATSKSTSLRPEPSTPEPAEIPRGVQDYFERLASQRSLMILVDDFQSIDEPSAAVFAGLAPLAARTRLVIVAACATDAPVTAQGALRLLKSYSRAVPLEPLQRSETESLLASVFGLVPNVQQLAHRLHTLAEGKPRLCMELAQHLVDTGVIRYEAGGFVLPELLAPGDLPASIEEALHTRFLGLPREAQRLCCVVALCSGAPLTVERCLELGGLAGTAAGERALSDLLASQLVVIEDEHVRLRDSTLASRLLGDQDQDELRSLRIRIADAFVRDPQLQILGAELYFTAGENAKGLDTLLAPGVPHTLVFEPMPSLHGLIARALKACQELDRPRRHSFELRRVQYLHYIHFTEPCDPRELLAFGEELARMAGLAQWHALEKGSPELIGTARLQRALELASAAYESASEHDRVYAPQEAIPELAYYLAALAGHGSSTFNLELLESIPPLGDFVHLAPGIQVSEWVVKALRDMRSCRHEAFIEGMFRVVDRLNQPDHGGMPPIERMGARLGVMYALALLKAALGDPLALEWADELDEMPSMRISAWRVRLLAHLFRGDTGQAEESRRQLELLLIQHGLRQAHQGTSLELELMGYANSDDLLSLRRSLPDVEAMAAKHAGWQPLVLVSQGELERIRGRLPQARVLYERALQLAKPGRHMIWTWAISFYIRALADLGEAERARELGLEAVEQCERFQMGVLADTVTASLAYAEGKCGDVDAAIARTDQLIARLESRKNSGLYTALRYELRAQLAVLAGDAEGLSRFIARGREHYGVKSDSPFTARVARLLASARAAGLVSEASAEQDERSIVGGSVTRLRRELAQCSDVDERAQRALQLLIEITGASHGHLYGARSGRFVLLASSHQPPQPTLLDQITVFIDRANRAGTEATEIVESETDILEIVDTDIELVSSPTTITNAGIQYSPFAIQADEDSTLVVAAVALAFTPGAHRSLPSRLLLAIGEELTARGDLTHLSFVR